MKRVMVLVIALSVVLPAVPAFAHGGFGWHGGGHARIGVYVGPGWGPGWWWPYPYYYPYYPQPPVVVEQPPEEYVQPAPQSEEPYYWYYCQDPQGYYPYVKKCPKGWLKVVPPENPPPDKE